MDRSAASSSWQHRLLLGLLWLPLVVISQEYARYDSFINLDPRSRSIQQKFLDIPSNDSAAEHLLMLTHRSHIAGSEADYENALFVASKFKEFGFDEVSMPEYDLFLSYPTDTRSLTASLPDGSWSYEATLKEPEFDGDPYSKDPEITPTFNAYSASGDVKAEVVFANYGRTEDFVNLKDWGVQVNGSIVLARYGQIYRGDIARNAALNGATAALIYSDPHDYNPKGGWAGKTGTYPDGPGLPLGGVQRGSVVAGAGDPLTPGWPSARIDMGIEAETIDQSDSRTGLVNIPVHPISAADALPLLGHMKGSKAPKDWLGDLDSDVYKIGRGPVVAHLNLKVDNRQAKVWDVIGIIKGSEEPDRYVILGNHRDAWVTGAADPMSGSACLLEVGRALGQLKATGWRPRRSIVLASWDAEEHNLGGSTEWGEQHELLLMQRAVAYLNVDVGVSGSGFWGSATPSLDHVVNKATRMVSDPDYDNRVSIFEHWRGKIDRLGDDGSDHACFVQHLGIPGTMIGYDPNQYPTYHSVFDNYKWMSEYIDPGFQRHVAITQTWGLMALTLADAKDLPLDYINYGKVLEGYFTQIQKSVAAVGGLRRVDLAPLEKALGRFEEAAHKIERDRMELRQHLALQRNDEGTFIRLRELNDRLMLAERGFLDPAGLNGRGEAKYRAWLRHLVFSPPQDNAYGEAYFPGILDAVTLAKNDASHWSDVQHEVWRAARAVDRVADILKGSLL